MENGLVIVTSCCPSSVERRPGSEGGEPIVNLPAGIGTSRMPMELVAPTSGGNKPHKPQKATVKARKATIVPAPKPSQRLKRPRRAGGADAGTAILALLIR